MPKFSLHHTILHKTTKRLPNINIKSKRTASYLTITLSFLSLSLFGLFAIRPTLMTALSLIKSVGDLQKLNVEYENKISSLIHAQSEYEKIREDLPLVDSALPSNSSFSNVAQSIERFAIREDVVINQLQIDSVPVSTLSASSTLYNYGFSLVGLGEYEYLSNFLSHIINWKRIITIKSLEFNQEGSTQSGILRLTLKGTAYYEP